MSSILQTSVQYLKGVGPKIAQVLEKQFGIKTYEDLLSFFPFRYVDKTKIVPIKDLQPEQEVVTYGIVIQKKKIGSGYQGRLVVVLEHQGYILHLLWFKGYNWVIDKIQLNQKLGVFGKVVEFKNQLQIIHAEFDLYENYIQNKQHYLYPIYSNSEKLQALQFVNKKFVNAIRQVLENIESRELQEIFPQEFLKKWNLISRYEAYKQIHLPINNAQVEEAKYRHKFEEFFFMQLQFLGTKYKRKQLKNGFIFNIVGDKFNTFYKDALPFELTESQKKVIKEIRQDTAHGFQMNRLLQGDVGSGKTIVALLSALLAIDNHFQVCIMAPTEVLANQHYETFSKFLSPLSIQIELLTGKVRKKKKDSIIEELSQGKINILIGTHALIQDYVKFKNLGLAIIDEQHRFGVEHRSLLWKKNIKPPHMLVMTATPIPRTLAMSCYGELDTSWIKELPKGRKKILTVHRFDSSKLKVYDFIKEQIKQGRQAYIVFPLIEESEKLDYENLLKGYENVKAFFPEPEYYISMVHGKQSSKIKETNMNRFVNKDTQIMVSTTVIEVGIDVPNANVMLIESSEKFGLSQLHQLRGRVGRGEFESYCILMTSTKLNPVALERLKILCKSNDGFFIAERDMEIRGAGEIVGTKQSGVIPFKIANPIEDNRILQTALEASKDLLNEDPELKLSKYVFLKKYISAHFADKSFWAWIS